jgi:ethanolamine utilization protein EutA (predicted chaperonin)|tara:strand:+ start:372 stop:584 length:213 start_codon:yes stop_codon:yes gene_type:complete
MTNTMTKEQLDQLKRSYAEMIVEGMDMKLLIEFAEDSIMENIKNYEMEDIKEEIVDCYGEDVWSSLTDTE